MTKIEVFYAATITALIVVFLIFIFCFFLRLSLDNIDNRLQELEGLKKECSHILYVYPGDKYPEIYQNAVLTANFLPERRLKSKFCKMDGTDCIADRVENAYDEYCIRWQYYSERDMMEIWFMENYTKAVQDMMVGWTENTSLNRYGLPPNLIGR